MDSELRRYEEWPITPELIDGLSSEFERNWDESEIAVVPTHYNRLRIVPTPTDTRKIIGVRTGGKEKQ
jgi:hypothetical protein